MPGRRVGVDANVPVAPCGDDAVSPTREKLFHFDMRSSGRRSPFAHCTSKMWFVPFMIISTTRKRDDHGGCSRAALGLPG